MIVLVISILSLFIIYQSLLNYWFNNKIKHIDKSIATNFKVCTELYKIYDNVNQNITLLNKASDINLKQNQQVYKDMIDFRNQVSEAILIILDSTKLTNSSGSSYDIFGDLLKSKTTKTKPN